MSRYKRLLMIPCIVIIISLYLIGVNILKRFDRVDDIRDAVPAVTESSAKREEKPKTEAEENEELLVIGDKININTATASELTLLDGIGDALAQKIIDKRGELGEYTSIEQLLEIKGIGDKLYSEIKDYVTVE